MSLTPAIPWSEVGIAPSSSSSLYDLQRQQLLECVAHQEQLLARQIQTGLVPPSLPVMPGVKLAGSSLAAAEAGGDFYDAVVAGPDAALLVIADVMGSGMKAAIVAAKFRAMFRAAADWSQSPGALLNTLNQAMFQELSAADTFVTAQVLLVNSARKELVLANAGHCPLLLLRSHEAIDRLAPDGLPVGVLHDTLYPEITVSLHPQAFALAYTDGITEACNPAGEFFGEHALETWFTEAAQLKDPDIIKQSLLAALHQHQSLAAARDDQTFLILAAT